MIIFRKFLISACLLELGTAGTALAASDVAPIDRNTVEQRQKALLDQARQQREALQNSIALPESPAEEGAPDDGYCQRIRHIELRGVSVLSPSTQKTLTAPWLNRCMTLSDIRQLVRAVSQAYLTRGYITSRAWLPEQDISAGRLRIAATEGRIESIELEGGTPAALAMAFPGSIGRVLDLRDLEQGMEQLNRLRSQQVTIDIQPGDRPGYSHVLLLPASAHLPLGVNLGADNSGQKSTGTGQMNALLTLDNPLRLADQWWLAASRDDVFRHDRRSRSLSGGVTLPYGYWLFSYQANWNDFHQDIPFTGAVWRYEGTAQSHRAGATRTLLRDGGQKLAVDVSLTRRRTENRMAGQRLTNSSVTVTSLTAGLNYSRTLGGGYLTFNPALSHGLRGMGAERDDPHYPDLPRRQFRKFSLSASYFHPLSPSLYYLTAAYAQTTPDNLYAGERISVGGQYSVRGFKEQYLSGNRGAYWRNELNWQFATLPAVGELSLSLALDGGRIAGRYGRDDGGTLAGAALGVSAGGRWLNQSFSVGTPLHYPETLHPDGVVVYWQASLPLTDWF